MKKCAVWFVARTLRCLAVVLWMFVFFLHPAAAGQAKNVIVLIADGCSAEQYTFARWFKGRPLSLDDICVGSVKTYIADSVIADSAPTASAYATGVRTSDNLISVGPGKDTLPSVPTPKEDLWFRPLATVLEGAKIMKKSTGIVSTSRVTHATPAAFAAHVASRDLENDIMEQMVYQNIDVVFGGGKRRLLPSGEKGERTDGEDLVKVLQHQGYRIVETRQEMSQIHSPKVFGMFAQSHMSAEIDRKQLSPHQPDLSEMAAKAIEILSKDPDGFFLMVEGSQIDWACHANDPAQLLSDLLAYDAAVKVALDFAIKNKETLVLALSDHNTGGFSIGNYATDLSYSQTKEDAFLDPFRKMQVSAPVLWKMTEKEKTPENIIRAVKTGWGMDISLEDALKILTTAKRYSPHKAAHYAFGEILCPKYTVVGWTTHGHCGGDVPLHAYGPGKPAGRVDGPEIGRICARALGLDLEKLTDRLFADARRSLPQARVTVDASDAQNPLILVEYQGKTFRLPVNKNIIRTGKQVQSLEACAIYISETGKAYIPMQAVRIIKGESIGIGEQE